MNYQKCILSSLHSDFPIEGALYRRYFALIILETDHVF